MEILAGDDAVILGRRSSFETPRCTAPAAGKRGLRGAAPIAFACLSTLASGPAAAPQDAAASAPAAQSAVRRALLVGCGEYPRLAAALPDAYEREIRLRGPENDVALMRDTLLQACGFHEADLTVLAGWSEEPATRPTREAILSCLARLAKVSHASDFALVYFAGHGAQQPVRRADLLHEPDALDEVLLPADVARFEAASGGIPSAITDNEIGAALAAIRDAGASVWLITDACHSATMLRGSSAGANLRLRGLGGALLGVPARPLGQGSAHGSSTASTAPNLVGIAAFHAAQSYGSAPEIDIDVGAGVHRSHGLFTWLLSKELVRSGGHVSYRELSGRVVSAYQAWPCQLTIPGAEGDLDRELWSGASSSERWSVVRDSDGGLRLDRGLLSGVGVGARVALIGAQGEPLAEAEVVEAGPFEARLALGQGRLPDGSSGCAARLASQPLPDARLPWALVDSMGRELDASTLPDSVRKRLLDSPENAARFPRSSPEQASLWVVHDGESWRLSPRAAEGGHDLLLSQPDRLDRDLAREAKARNLIGFAAGGLPAPLPTGLEFWIEVRRGAHGAPRRLGAGELVVPGEELRVRVKKRADSMVDLNVFYIDSQRGITCVFPRSGASPRLGLDVAGELTLLDWTTLVDTSLGIEHVLAIAQERGAAEPVLDLGFLAQDEIPRTRGTGDPFGQMLAGLARAETTRGLRLEVGQAKPLGAALATLRLDWPELGAPPWPKTTVAGRHPPPPASASASSNPGRAVLDPAGVPPGFAPPLALGSKSVLAHSPAAGTGCDLVLSGGEEVELVLVDFGAGAAAELSPAEALASGKFAPRAAFRFEANRRVAYYARSAGGLFDLVLVDADGNGLAEERWLRSGEAWRREGPLAVPWLSQAWAGMEGEVAASARATRVLSSLVRASPRDHP